jgi:hypothetical protein
VNTETSSARSLRQELIRLFRSGADAPVPEHRFNSLACRVFAHNFESVPAYRAYCQARGRTPATVTEWVQIPAVPTAAFKELKLRDENAGPFRIFRTSGTSRGPERRGAHHVGDLGLYRASLRAAFEAFLLPDGARPRCVSLMVPSSQAPDSSLAFMISDVMSGFGDGRGLVAAGTSGLDYPALVGAMEQAMARGEPVLLLGTSAAFTHWMGQLTDTDTEFELPEGSRLMDTGGYKGRGKRIEPEVLRAAYQARLGLPSWACVNEYGMTELLSQYYDAGLRDRLRRTLGPPRKRGPGWLKSVAVDPESLEPLASGETGLLRHVDLANLHSVAAIQTEDLGRVDAHGLTLEGRATGAPTRGCSIAMDLLLEEAP